MINPNQGHDPSLGANFLRRAYGLFWGGVKIESWGSSKLHGTQTRWSSKARKVLKLGVAEAWRGQSAYWAPLNLLAVSVFTRVPGTAHFVRWSHVASTRNVRPSALLAVGFSMEPVEQLPLSWPLGLRRPAGRRRLGPAYVMDGGVQAQLSPLGPLTNDDPGAGC